MKKKVWDITVKDNPNRVVMGENDEFYTTDTETYLVFKLDDENFNPTTAVLTLENRNDGSLKNETVDVVDGLIEWEMPQRYIEHFGNWQGQLVYEDTKDGQPELYTSATFSFVVNPHIGDKKKPSLVEIENWEKFIREGTELIGGWKEYILELKQRVDSGEFKGADGDMTFEELTPEQIEMLRGLKGDTGNNLEFIWNDTQLGVRVEGQPDYQYIDLKGEKGDTGTKIEFEWSGTQLGIREEGQLDYQYMDLKGDQGEQGVQGEQGEQGNPGKNFEYNWNGSQLGVRQQGETTYQYVNLKGDKGDTGDITSLNANHIETALGYIPADEAGLSTDSVTLQGRTPSNFIEVVNHGTTSDYARPVGGISVLWIGTVEPQNATDNDIWIGGL